MANRLRMAEVHSILSLRAQGWSHRRIARALGIHRETVARYLGLVKARSTPAALPDVVPKPAIALTGCSSGSTHAPTSSADEHDPKPAIAPIGSRDAPTADGTSELEALVTAQPEGAGRKSVCEPLREAILAKLTQGLSAVRIHQDLTREQGAAISYHSVRRFVRRLEHGRPLPFRRMECEPGEQAQADFGCGAPILVPADPNDPDAQPRRRRRTHVFRIVLSHSRKGYSEAVFRQTTDDVIACLENAFRYFGGVPRTLVIDNLKAAVTKADWFDPELNPKIEAFCRHYGTVMLPTRPRMPRHKGKIERGIDYVQENGLKGRGPFKSLEDQNRHLREWEQTVADTRIHGTTRQQIAAVFEQIEKPALLPLPIERFPCFQEAPRIVQRDGHVAVARAFYSAPPEYVGHQVWVRWDSHLVRLFNRQKVQIAVHARREPGRFSTQNGHIVTEKIAPVERGAAWLLERARTIGPQSGRWAEAMLAQRGVEGLRVLNGLIRLAQRHPATRIEDACRVAHSHAAYRLRDVRRLIDRREAAPQEQLEFLDRHPIIRDLSAYDAVLRGTAQEEFIQESIQRVPYREPAWTSAAFACGTEQKSLQREEVGAARVSEALRAMLPEPEEKMDDE